MSERVTLADVHAACDRAKASSKRTKEACNAVLERNTLWLALHPFQTHEMRKRIRAERDVMRRERDEMNRLRDLFLAQS